MRHCVSLATTLLVLLILPLQGTGQIPDPAGEAGPAEGELVDRVAAVVGDSIILYSQVQEELARVQAQLQAEGRSLPEDPEEIQALEREIVGDLVNQMLVLQAADQDTLVSVSDARVEDTFRQAWNDQLQRFGSESDLRAAVEARGETLAQYRAGLREEIRKSLLQQSYLQSQRAGAEGVVVEEDEVREYYERERDRFGERPATLTIRHVFFDPQPSDSAKTAARERAEELLDMLRQGEEFETLARRYSDDTESAQEGGDLGWYRRGDGLVEDFEDAAFALREGQTSGVVETPFGAHIIRTDRVRGPERRIRHILVAAETTSDDEERARTRAEEAAEQIRQGASFAEFSEDATRFGIPDSLTVQESQLDQFPEAYATALRGSSQGEVVGPVRFPLGEQDLHVYAVARVDERREAGEFSYEDVRGQIRTNLRDQRFTERLVERLRTRTYVDIRL